MSTVFAQLTFHWRPSTVSVVLFAVRSMSFDESAVLAQGKTLLAHDVTGWDSLFEGNGFKAWRRTKAVRGHDNQLNMDALRRLGGQRGKRTPSVRPNYPLLSFCNLDC